MSNPQTFAALPERAVDRLFARFAAMYGDAAMKRMWGQQTPEAVKGIWADALGRFDMAALMNGLRHLEDAGKTFPPTLPEFVAACRAKPETMPAEHRPYLPPPEPSAAERAAGKVLADRIARQIAARPSGRDPAGWAYSVIKRYEGGDKVVAHASYKIAQDALRELGRTA